MTDTQAPELKPCPFCGGGARFECSIHGWIVLCGERATGCQVESRTLHFSTAHGAFAAWNTRLEALEAENKRLRELLEDAASAVEWGARRIESPSQRLLMEKWANEYRKALEGE